MKYIKIKNAVVVEVVPFSHGLKITTHDVGNPKNEHPDKMFLTVWNKEGKDMLAIFTELMNSGKEIDMECRFTLAKKITDKAVFVGTDEKYHYTGYEIHYIKHTLSISKAK